MANSLKLRVLVVDGISLTRFALVALTRLHPTCEVCGEAASAPEARQRCVEAKPDLAVVDLAVPRGDGLVLLRELRKLHPPVRLLAVSDRDDLQTVRRALRAGATGYVTRLDELREFQSALESVMRGEIFASHRVSRRLLQDLAPGERPPGIADLDRLSDRELHVFRLVGDKLGPTAVAQQLGVSVKTVETYQRRIKEKLELCSCSELHKRAALWSEKRHKVRIS
jgi:DNA-binding NarL/FixJ family response regulator